MKGAGSFCTNQKLLVAWIRDIVTYINLHAIITKKSILIL
jgi:hypothetical protein